VEPGAQWVLEFLYFHSHQTICETGLAHYPTNTVLRVEPGAEWVLESQYFHSHLWSPDLNCETGLTHYLGTLCIMSGARGLVSAGFPQFPLPPVKSRLKLWDWPRTLPHQCSVLWVEPGAQWVLESQDSTSTVPALNPWGPLALLSPPPLTLFHAQAVCLTRDPLMSVSWCLPAVKHDPHIL
jgi:hypothetical protein